MSPRRALGLLAILVAVLPAFAVGGCTGDDAAQVPPTTSVTEATVEPEQPPGGQPLPGERPAPGPGEQQDALPASTVPLSIPPPQDEPSGFDEMTDASAALVKDCAARADCSGMEAPRLVWPGGRIAEIDWSLATLTGADLRGASAAGGNFAVANFSGANLSGADFSGANLSGADLTGAFLVNTRFAGADLRGADLRDAVIDGADFQAATLCETTMPDGSVRNDDC